MTSAPLIRDVNERRIARGKEPVTMMRIERICRWLFGEQTHDRNQLFREFDRKGKPYPRVSPGRDPLMYQRHS